MFVNCHGFLTDHDHRTVHLWTSRLQKAIMLQYQPTHTFSAMNACSSKSVAYAPSTNSEDRGVNSQAVAVVVGLPTSLLPAATSSPTAVVPLYNLVAVVVTPLHLVEAVVVLKPLERRQFDRTNSPHTKNQFRRDLASFLVSHCTTTTSAFARALQLLSAFSASSDPFCFSFWP